MMTPLQQASIRFKGKNVLVLGLGLLGGGVGDVRFFLEVGATVRVTDQKTYQQLEPSLNQLKGLDISLSLNQERLEDIDWADIVLKNPSIPDGNPLLEEAKKQHKPIVMRSSLFVELAGVKTIGITGTRGKTTTTYMIHSLAKQLSNSTVILGGNIAGISDLELLKTITEPDKTLAVLELSSWQLQGFGEAQSSPTIAVLTNLYPDHLNRYPNEETYYKDKKNIVLYQQTTDFAIMNQDQPQFLSWAKEIKSQVYLYTSRSLPENCLLKIPGEHNRYNAAAALTVANIMGWPEAEACKILADFSGVPYRLETIANKNGITFVNDTTATTPVAAVIALEAMSKPPILICGGNDKNLPLDPFVQKLGTTTKAIILLPGTGSDRIRPHLPTHIPTVEVRSMAEAVSTAQRFATSGDIILLSPGFTSFGLFSNEFDRGDQFNQCVHDIT